MLDDREPKSARYLERMREVMTEEEIASARRATINSHFTSIGIVGAMWDAVRRMGFDGGDVLEPAVGIGHFFGTMPPALKRAGRRVGIDLDDLSARIATKLYPQSQIVNGAFEATPIPNNTFDLAISNVPFAAAKVRGEDYTLPLHDYFFMRALDKVRPGGLVAFITSHWTMDKASRGMRDALGERADLVGAIRLPSDAFSANAATEVTTDILFLRKKGGGAFEGGETFGGLAEVGTFASRTETDPETGRPREMPILVNEYFARHPEMVLGRHSMQGKMRGGGDEYTLTPTMGGEKFAKALAEAVGRLPEGVVGRAAAASPDQPKVFARERGQRLNLTVVAPDGSVRIAAGDELVVPEWMKKRAVGEERYDEPITREEAARREAIARDWIGIRDAARDLIESERSETITDAELDDKRRHLNEVYDRFIREHARGRYKSLGHPIESMRTAAFLDNDPYSFLVESLEEEKVTVDANGKARRSWVKAPIFRQRQSTPAKPPTRAESIEDAITTSLAWYAEVRSDYIAALTGSTVAEAEEKALASGRVFRDPAAGTLVVKERYLSGNVRKKLLAARAAAADNPAYTPNIAALEAVQPANVPFPDIRFNLGSRWIPGAVYSAFMEEALGATGTVKYHQAANAFSVVAQGGSSDYNTPDFSTVALFRHALNGTSPQVTKTEGSGENRRTVVDQEATTAAMVMIEQIKARFIEWASTTERTIEWRGKPVLPQVAMEDLYNETINAVVAPVHDGSYLALPGMSSYVRRTPHRLSFIARLLQEGSAVQAHGVGSGKTLGQIVAAMEMRRLGRARKPMIVVQKATIRQFAAAFGKAYPNANILVATERTFSAKNRKRLMAQIATQDFDAIIVTQPQFDRIPNKPESTIAYLAAKAQELREILATIDGDDRRTIKQIEGAIQTLVNKMDALTRRAQAAADRSLYWEELGVDALFIDEAHAYKRAPIVTRKTRVKGVPSQASNRAISAEIKIQQIQAAKQGRNVVLSTGTPVTNTTAEAYIMLRLATPNVLKEYGIENFDDFADTFGRAVERTEYGVFGKFKRVTRFDRFINLPELVTMIRSGFDVKIGNKELGLKVPEIKGGKPEMVIVPATPANDAINNWIKDIGRAWDALEPKERRELSYIPIVTMGAGIAAAVDPRLIDPTLPDEPGSKINTAADRIAAIHAKTGAFRGTQLVFCDVFSERDTSTLRQFVGGARSTTAITEEDARLDAAAEEEEGDAERTERAIADEARAHKDAGKFNVYRDIRKKLIARGIPEAEIAIIQEHNTDKARMKLFDAVNAGAVRVLLGSTEAMGVGVNVQQRLIAMHHLDPPRMMTPAMMEQRNGRGIRQHEDGDLPEYRKEIEILYYGVERSMDTAIYQKLETKQIAINQLLNGQATGREAEDAADEVSLSFAVMMALLTGDARVIREVELDADVRKLYDEKRAHDRSIGEWRRKSGEARWWAQNRREVIARMRSRAEAFSAALGEMGDDLRIKFFERTEEGRKGVVEVLERMLVSTRNAAKAEGAPKLAEAVLNGLRLEVVTHPPGILNAGGEQKTDYKLSTSGEAHKISGTVTTGSGILTSIRSQIDPKKIAEREAEDEQGSQRLDREADDYARRAGQAWPKLDELRRLEGELKEVRDSLAGEAAANTPDPAMRRAASNRRQPPATGGTEAPAASRPSAPTPIFSRTGAKHPTTGDPVLPVAMPELVRLARELMGDLPTLRRFRKSKGMFYPQGRGQIRLDPSLGTDPDQLAQVLAHEVGHLFDYLPEGTLQRGNLVGRIHSLRPTLNRLGQLRGYLKQRYRGMGSKNAEIRKELLALTQWWSGPYTKQEKAYREAPMELYAEALSVLLNSPGELAARAPRFYEDFLRFLDAKPEVRDAYLELMDLLAGTPESLARARRADIREAFAKGEAIIKARAEERRLSAGSIRDRVFQALVDKAGPVIAYQKRAKRAGLNPAMERAAYYAMEELAYRDNVNHLMLVRIQREVVDRLKQSGLSYEDAGEYLMLRRIEAGDRAELVNPHGHTPATAKEMLADLERSLGPDRFADLAAAMDRFHGIIFESVERAVAVGSYNDKVFKEKIEPNRDTYATFAVLDYLQDHISPGIKEQVGTFKEIASPFLATVMKTLALNRLNELQAAKRAVIDMLEANWKGDIAKVPTPRGPDGIPLPPKPPSAGREHLVVLENGHAAYYETDPWIVKAFSHHDIGILSRIGRAIGSPTYKVFHPLYVTISPSWQVFNIVRDIKRTYKLLAAASASSPAAKQGLDMMLDLLRVPAAYAGAVGAAARRASRRDDPLITEMIEDRAIGPALHAFDYAPSGEQNYDALLRRYGLDPHHENPSLLRAIALKIPAGLEWFGIFQETLPKVAAWKMLSARGIDGRRRAEHVRNRAGTPNTKRRGLATDLTNGLLMYSNVVVQGYRADAEIALKPTTAAGYWARSLLIDFLPKLAMVAAAYGLFGDDVEEWLKAIPEYDLAKYIIIPLGWVTDEKTGARKAAYLRIPHDDTNRLIAGAMYLVSAGRREDNVRKALGLVLGETPGLSPPIEMVAKWSEFLAGQNPRDTFRGRDIIPRDHWEAGFWPSAVSMAGWSANQFGVLSSTVRWWAKGDSNTTRMMTSERAIGSIPGLSRIIGISDRGLTERQWIDMDNEARERARLKLTLPEKARNLTRERYRLQSVKETLGRDDLRRLTILNNWYTSAYIPLTRAIEDLEARGRKSEAKGYRDRLEEASGSAIRALAGPGAGGGATSRR